MKNPMLLLPIMGLCIGFAGVSISGSAGASDAASIWKAVGPQGGNIKSMAFYPKNKSEIYATVGPGLYQTKNGGVSWKRIVVTDDYLVDVVPNPVFPGCLSLLSDEFIYGYRSYTQRWLKKSFGSSTFAGDGPLLLDPKNPNIFHVAGRTYSNGVTTMAYLKSLDGGNSWKAQIVSPSPRYAVLNAIALCPTDPKTIYVGGWGQDSSYRTYYKIYKSTNGGSTWLDKTGPINSEPKAIIHHPKTKNKVYVATTSNIWRSSDGGNTWAPNNGEASGYCLSMDSANPDTLYAGHDKKLYRSTDGGINWNATPEGFYGTCHTLLVSSGTIYAGTLTGIYWSRDGGTSWSPRQKGLNAGMAHVVASAPSSPNVVYAALLYDGLYRSTDSAKTWTRLPDFERSEYVGQILVSPYDANTVLILIRNYGSIPDEILKSQDGGSSWTRLFSGFLEGLTSGAGDFNRLYVAGQVQDEASSYLGYHVSLDGGTTWTSKKLSTEPGSVGNLIALAPSDENIILLGGGLGFSPRLFKSTDGGLTWKDFSKGIPPDGPINSVAFDPKTPSIVYAGAGGLFRSANGGSTWVRKRSDFTFTILVHPTSPSTVYAGCLDGLYRSMDTGNGWQGFKEGLACTYVKWLNLDQTNNILYAGTSGGSVFKRQI